MGAMIFNHAISEADGDHRDQNVKNREIIFHG